MKSALSVLLLCTPALLVSLLVGSLPSAAQSAPTAQFATALSSIPSRPGLDLQPLSVSAVSILPTDAVAAAKEQWGLTDGQIEYNTGVVPAIATIQGDINHRNVPVVLVVADIVTYDPAPNSDTMYQKMVIVVSATTGAAL